MEKLRHHVRVTWLLSRGEKIQSQRGKWCQTRGKVFDKGLKDLEGVRVNHVVTRTAF